MGKKNKNKSRRRRPVRETDNFQTEERNSACNNESQTTGIKTALKFSADREKKQSGESEGATKSSRKRKRNKEATQTQLEIKKKLKNEDSEHPAAEQINLIEPEFPFSVDADDHCESPEEAYRDILPLLLRLGPQRSNKSKSNSTLDGNTQLRIYDPYYCNGAVVQNFTNLGLPHVYNKKENCYEIWRTENKVRYPSFDVLITNPPYSGNHIEKLIDHLTSSSSLFAVTSEQSRAWFLLLPNWVHKKDYYERAMTSRNIRPFYLVPRKRYVYLPPKDFRSAKKSDVHKKSSPFVSMWYIWGGDAERTEQLVRAFYAAFSGREPTCDLARSKSALRDLRRKPRK